MMSRCGRAGLPGRHRHRPGGRPFDDLWGMLARIAPGVPTMVFSAETGTRAAIHRAAAAIPAPT